jgi:hypothetical protein
VLLLTLKFEYCQYVKKTTRDRFVLVFLGPLITTLSSAYLPSFCSPARASDSGSTLRGMIYKLKLTFWF